MYAIKSFGPETMVLSFTGYDPSIGAMIQASLTLRSSRAAQKPFVTAGAFDDLNSTAMRLHPFLQNKINLIAGGCSVKESPPAF